MKRKVLDKRFFIRPTLEVAQDLLGKFLISKIFSLNSKGARVEKEIAVMINEVEAYDGQSDRASHASRGMTQRNAVMFDEGGYFYIYLCYGMYEMLNVVTGPKNYPAAILIRGAIVAEEKGDKEINFNGPGKLTKYLKINRRFNKKEIKKETGLWLEDRGVKIDKKKIKKTPRIGVAYAGPVWAKKRYRFVLTK